MTDKKISELTSITGANVSDANDVLPIVDTSVATTKKITRAELFKSVSSVDLAAIAETKAVTAVDVFVYDTSKDSDGGAWRKRTQHTSWYNETLNTATRGSRREFPAVAVIVAESNKVTIYDGDDPDLPMWRVASSFGGSLTTFWFSQAGIGANATSVAALNGKIVFGLKDGIATSSDGYAFIDFASDNIGRYTTLVGRYGEGLPVTSTGTSDVFPIKNKTQLVPVNGQINDVAMTVLPDAPIDPVTGLPVPTIAVATAGGVSVITDSGAVYDSGKTTGATDATIDGDRLRIAFTDSDVLAYDLSAISADGFTGDIYDPATTPALLGTTTSLAKDAAGSSAGLTLLAENQETPGNGMIARITSSYNSGYQNGNIKGAFLADTDDTDLVGSGELVTNGTFDTDSDWTKGAGWTITGGEAVATASTTSLLSTAFTTVVGKTYVASFEVKTVIAGNVRLVAYNGSSNVGTTAFLSAPGVYDFTFVANTTSTYVYVFRGSSAFSGTIDNVSVKLADADRSVNNNGLIVNGTVTRTAVATGADLVAYSGFSASNYLEQPYNSGLDFGTGDFAIMGWLKQAANTAVETILERDSAVSAQRFTLAVNASGFLTFTCDDDTTARTATSNRVVDNDVWTHFVALYDGAGDVKIYLNGVLDDTETGSALLTLNNASAVLRVGLAVDDAEPLANADLALLRISATVPSDSQIKKIYEDEKVLFQEGAQATLYGASDAVTALAHDPVTDLLHVGTSAGRSVFQGLRRVSNTTTAVGTAISASNGLVVEE